MSPLSRLLPGHTLKGRYRIDVAIGHGAMAVVFAGTDLRLRRKVAIKIINSPENDPAMLRERFRREAHAVASLPRHPNLVEIYDYDTDPELDLDFIVMELLHGQDLHQLLKQNPPSMSESLDILHQAAQGLAVGHRAGLIHRDVKPGNLFLEDVGGRSPFVRLLDFGIATRREEVAGENHLTVAGRVPHTPSHASPEQLQGIHPLTPASDVFNLGTVAFLLLTGSVPYSEESRRRVAQRLAVAPPRVHDREPGIPPEVATVVDACLRFDPGERIANAGVLAESLSELIAYRGERREYAPGARPPLAWEADRTMLAPEPEPADEAPPGPGQRVQGERASLAKTLRDHLARLRHEYRVRSLLRRGPPNREEGGPAPGVRRWYGGRSEWLTGALGLAALVAALQLAPGSSFRPMSEPPAFLALRGTIRGDIPIRMELYQEGKRVRGSYEYVRYGNPVSIQGSLGERRVGEDGRAGWEISFDGFYEGEQLDSFVGVLRDDSTLSGEWTKADGTRRWPFELSQRPAP